MQNISELKKQLLLIIGLLIVSMANAQTDTLNINIALMKSTFRISGEGQCGTCFIMLKYNKKYKEKSTDLDFVLITVAHVLDNIKGDEATIFFRKKTNDHYETVPYKTFIRNKKKNFYTKHPNLDIAVMPISISKSLNYKNFLEERWLATEKDLTRYNITTGETIYCLGYPLCPHDDLGNFPILRSGKIASYPIIPMAFYKTFLFDFEIYAGNSGGPVYFFEDGLHPITIGKDMFKIGGRNTQFIMGLITQEICVGQNEGDKTSIKIGKVIHSKYILETIRMLPI